MTRAEYEATYGEKPVFSAPKDNIFDKAYQKSIQIGNNVIEAATDPLTVIPQRLREVTPSKRDVGLLSGQIKDATEEEKSATKDRLLNFALSLDGGASSVAPKVKKAVREVTMKAPSLDIPKFRSKIVDFFSKDVEDKAAVILKETPSVKFDEYVQLAKEAVLDPRKPTPFEVVGEKIQEATVRLSEQAKSFSQQKKAIISQAKTGLANFSKQTGDTILNIRREVGQSQIGQAVIEKLKGVRTKIDADNAIDEIQDMIYTGNQNMTIPRGSMVDKKLRAIIGQYNSSLKSTLPKAYGDLNTKISNRIEITDTLNRALGETVDGVATRGSGLIKQFFGNSAQKTKELFDYIKKNTGIDLAQDATLAKFTMEVFDDARARSLLEGGIPQSVSGFIGKAVDTIVDKTGVGTKLKDSFRDSTLDKARDLTK